VIIINRIGAYRLALASRTHFPNVVKGGGFALYNVKIVLAGALVVEGGQLVDGNHSFAALTFYANCLKQKSIATKLLSTYHREIVSVETTFRMKVGNALAAKLVPFSAVYSRRGW
jgi:hypothetical protein